MEKACFYLVFSDESVQKSIRKYIAKKHDESEKFREVSDKEILENFVDEIFVPEIVSGKLSGKIFNNILRNLSKLVRHFV